MPYDVKPFYGFPESFADFLFQLQFNNTTDSLPENKITYKHLITEPLTLLCNALTPTALLVSETLITKPSKCVSTMYNDMRFSRDTPLKGYMYIRFREPSHEKDILGLYFDMGYDYYSYGDMRTFVHYPLSIFPSFIRVILTYILPWAIINYYPSMIILHKVQTTEEFVLGILSPVIGILFFLLSLFIFNCGLRRYSGSGS
ncbi:MAG: DUF2461 family protein [Ruminiclostridium sp.]|nr:DUF2461 family protein [Ruminiclostridium sp.]